MNSQYLKSTIENGQTYWIIEHPKCQAKISQFGGQLLNFTPHNTREDILWLSKSAVLDGSKAIRGGVPFCWPWFGPATGEFEGEPQHGYIRALPWQIVSVDATDERVTLVIKPQMPEAMSESLGLDVEAQFEFSETAVVSLITENISNSPKALSQAIHSYFNVADINKTQLHGLEGSKYVDKLNDSAVFLQSDTVALTEHADRVYLSDAPTLVLNDGSRQTKISGQSHDSIVVWNPWQELAANMADFDDAGFETMICVEMANTQGLELAPGERHSLSQTFSAVD